MRAESISLYSVIRRGIYYAKIVDGWGAAGKKKEKNSTIKNWMNRRKKTLLSYASPPPPLPRQFLSYIIIYLILYNINPKGRGGGYRNVQHGSWFIT